MMSALIGVLGGWLLVWWGWGIYRYWQRVVNRREVGQVLGVPDESEEDNSEKGYFITDVYRLRQRDDEE